MKQSVFLMILAGVFGLGINAQTQEKSKAPAKQIPKTIIDSLKAKFPKAVIDKWSREKEGDNVVYDIEFRQDAQKFEADIKENGTIDNWEKQIPAKDLPAIVRQAVDARYPNASMKEVMRITTVKNGKDELEGYEIVLRTAAKKEIEVTVSPDGKILEDSGEKK